MLQTRALEEQKFQLDIDIHDGIMTMLIKGVAKSLKNERSENRKPQVRRNIWKTKTAVYQAKFKAERKRFGMLFGGMKEKIGFI